MKILLQQLEFKENITQQISIENKHWMKKIQAPEVIAIECSLMNSN